MGKKIAVIGGGIAGLTAAYLLHREHRVIVFEKSGRLGGNAYSITTPEGDRPDIAVAAFGRAGYPNFYALLEELGVETGTPANTFMSFHDLETKKGLYLTPSFRGSLRQRFQFLSPGTLKSLYRLVTGLNEAQRLLQRGRLKGLAMRECLRLIPGWEDDAGMILVCVLCLMSSMSFSEVLKAPAEFFVNKLRVHHDVVSPKFLYSVRAVKAGTHAYVSALAGHFSESVVLKSKIKAVVRKRGEVTLVMNTGKNEKFDAVVFSCNADQALKLLDRPTSEEKELLGVWRYKEGRVVVHKDHSAFPAKDLIQAYTYLHEGSAIDGMDTSVNGALWFEPHVSKDCDYICTQHPNFPIRKDLVCYETVLRTPIFDFKSVETIPKLPGLNGVLNTYYCGSHFGFGLHEDAVTSAISAVQGLGVKWRRSRPSRGFGNLWG